MTGLNTSLIDTMFLIWSLRLMTRLSWEDVYAFTYEAIGISFQTTMAMFHEANETIGRCHHQQTIGNVGNFARG